MPLFNGCCMSVSRTCGSKPPYINWVDFVMHVTDSEGHAFLNHCKI